MENDFEKFYSNSINENELNFCLNFIIETALRLQQFDFEIPDNLGELP